MPAKVLIIEDDPHAVELVRIYLSRDGHDVVTSGDSLEGLLWPEKPISTC